MRIQDSTKDKERKGIIHGILNAPQTGNSISSIDKSNEREIHGNAITNLAILKNP